MLRPPALEVPAHVPVRAEPGLLQFFEALPAGAGREGPAVRDDHEEAPSGVHEPLVVGRVFRLHRGDLARHEEQLRVGALPVGAVDEPVDCPLHPPGAFQDFAEHPVAAIVRGEPLQPPERLRDEPLFLLAVGMPGQPQIAEGAVVFVGRGGEGSLGLGEPARVQQLDSPPDGRIGRVRRQAAVLAPERRLGEGVDLDGHHGVLRERSADVFPDPHPRALPPLPRRGAPGIEVRPLGLAHPEGAPGQVAYRDRLFELLQEPRAKRRVVAVDPDPERSVLDDRRGP